MTIKFTLETKTNKRLSFLDTLIQKAESSLETSVYFNSNLSLSVKKELSSLYMATAALPSQTSKLKETS